MIVKLLVVNAFSDSLVGGNPAGVLLNSPILSEDQMKFICRELNVSETAFIFPSDDADYKVRFFSPEIEVDLCGHATIASVFSILKKNFLKKNNLSRITQSTNIGILPVEIYYEDDNIDKVMMIQKKPELVDINLNYTEIASALNVNEESFDTSFPKQKVSTGLFTLPICIKTFDVIKDMSPNFILVKDVCKKYNVGSIHTFTFDTLESKSIYHARNFAPLYGINEDPVTGTANGAVCSYLYFNDIITNNNLICEQGDIINRSGRVFVEINNDEIKVGGKAVIVEERDFLI